MSQTRWNELAQTEPWIADKLASLSKTELEDSFYKALEFGTAGMRGLLGVGPNRMNIYTVGRATVGFAKYLCETYEDQPLKVAIAYDNRHQSREFAEVSAKILSSYGIRCHVFSLPRPTPELSFAVRQFGCVGGIVITASHNPKEYNGYKVYDETGCQLVDDKIARVIELIGAIDDETTIDLNVGNYELIEYVEEAFDEQYKDAIKSIQLRPNEEKTIKIVFTSQHGTSFPLVPDILTETGYDVTFVCEQSNYDPDFSNTITPNPEDKDSFKRAIELAHEIDADLVLSCDPDADRMGIAVKDHGDYVFLTGNQGGSILQEYIYTTKIETDDMPQHPVMFNTIVTSDLGEKIARKYGVDVEKTLTGFKYIGEKIHKHEMDPNDDTTFVFGYEESYGYLIAEFVRDKDALQACMIVAEAANYYLNRNQTFVDVLDSLYQEHGAYHETQVALTLSGAEGLKRIQEILSTFRNSKIENINGVDVVLVEDFLTSMSSNEAPLNFPKSNVLKYTLDDGSWIAIRPSGTEPKCKFYYCVKGSSIEDALNKFEGYKEAISKIGQL